MCTAHMSNERTAEELLVSRIQTTRRLQTCNQEREREREQTKTIKTKPFGAQTTINTSIKQETMGYGQPSIELLTKTIRTRKAK